jgi:hypothetical protein
MTELQQSSDSLTNELLTDSTNCQSQSYVTSMIAGQSASLSWCQAHPSGAQDQISITFRQLRSKNCSVVSYFSVVA